MRARPGSERNLRRTLGSWQAATGASLQIIGRSLGHKNLATTAIYARLDLEPVQAAVNTAAAAIMDAGNGKTAKSLHDPQVATRLARRGGPKRKALPAPDGGADE